MPKRKASDGFRFFSSNGDNFRFMPPIPPMPPKAPFPPRGAFMFNTMNQSPNRIYQEIDDDQLLFYHSLPGIDKSSLKLRSKPDKISISADFKEEYQKIFGEADINISWDLQETVIPEEAKASYKDGILKVVFPLAEPAKTVNFEE